MSQSEWSKIKVYKGPADARRSALFTRMARLITVAAREGGGDQYFNFKLRSAVDRALNVNMPKDSIERAIKKGTGELASENIEEVLYEGYGPGGVAVLVEALTDNRNRTAANVKFAFTGNNGNLGASGAVKWMFERAGEVKLDGKELDDDAELALIDAGALEVSPAAGEDANGRPGGGGVIVLCHPDTLARVRTSSEDLGFSVVSAGFTWNAKDKVSVSDAEQQKDLQKMFTALEEDEDVSEFYTNLV